MAGLKWKIPLEWRMGIPLCEEIPACECSRCKKELAASQTTGVRKPMETSAARERQNLYIDHSSNRDSKEYYVIGTSMGIIPFTFPLSEGNYPLYMDIF